MLTANRCTQRYNSRQACGPAKWVGRRIFITRQPNRLLTTSMAASSGIFSDHAHKVRTPAAPTPLLPPADLPLDLDRAYLRAVLSVGVGPVLLRRRAGPD